MDELVKTIPKPPDENYILSSFQQLQVKEAVDAGSFHVASMNDCLIKGQSLPPLIVLYPNIVLEGDLCIIFGQSLPCRWQGKLLPKGNECSMLTLR